MQFEFEGQGKVELLPSTLTGACSALSDWNAIGVCCIPGFSSTVFLFMPVFKFQ